MTTYLPNKIMIKLLIWYPYNWVFSLIYSSALCLIYRVYFILFFKKAVEQIVVSLFPTAVRAAIRIIQKTSA